MKTALILAASAGLVAAAFGLQPSDGAGAQAAPAGPHRACFYSHQVANYQPFDDRTIYVRASGRRVFRIDLANDCPARSGLGQLVIEAVSGPICGPLDFNLTVVDGPQAQRCMVSGITQLNAGEVAALPARARP